MGGVQRRGGGRCTRENQACCLRLRTARLGMQGSRACVVVSPDELNAHMGTFIAAPLTTGDHRYRFRIPCSFDGKDGHVVPDQLRAVDRERLVKRLGVLREMFAP